MKIVQESVFLSSLRAFCVALFGMAGAAVAIIGIVLGVYALAKGSNDSSLSPGVKILPDAEGSRKELASSTPVLLVVNLRGQIGADHLTGKKIEKILLKSREDDFKDDRVKGILLVIDSPGGSVNDSDIIYRHIQQYKERFKVPVYAYIDGLCASGGYYIACAADKIYASNVSLIGSVGVLAWPPFVNVYDALQKLGVSSVTLSAGEGKDELNPLRPWHEGEQAAYQKLINFYYGQFVSLVTERRPQIDQEKLEKEYGAHMFPAPMAKEYGFIDGTNTYMSDTLTELRKAAGIDDKDSYQVVAFESKNWLKKALNMHSPLVTGRLHHELALPPQMNGSFYFR